MIYDPDEALQHELADFPRCRLEICRSAEYVSASPSQAQPAPASTSQGLQPIGSEPHHLQPHPFIMGQSSL